MRRRRGRPAAVPQRAAARNARIQKDELELIDTRMFWHDVEQRARIIQALRERGGQLINEQVIWRTKSGRPLHLLLSYVQVAYQGGHVGFAGGKRVLWVYDITALTSTRRRSSSRSASFTKSWTTAPRRCAWSTRTGGILFHNRRLRDLLGYEQHELELFDTKRFWHDLDHRARIIEVLRTRGGQLLNEEVVWKTKQRRIAQSADLLRPGRLCRRPRRGGRRQAAVLALRHHAAAPRRAGAAAQRAAARRSDREHLRGLRLLRRRGPAGDLQFQLPQSALSRPGDRISPRARRSRASSGAPPSVATSRMRKAASRNGLRSGCISTAIPASRRCSGAATAAG